MDWSEGVRNDKEKENKSHEDKSGKIELKLKQCPIPGESNGASDEGCRRGTCGGSLQGSSSSWGVRVARNLRTRYQI